MLFDRTGIFRRGVLCSRNFEVSERFMKTRGQGGEGGRSGKYGVSRVPVGNLLSYITVKIRKVSLQCFKKFPVRKSFMQEPGLSQFSVKCF